METVEISSFKCFGKKVDGIKTSLLFTDRMIVAANPRGLWRRRNGVVLFKDSYLFKF